MTFKKKLFLSSLTILFFFMSQDIQATSTLPSICKQLSPQFQGNCNSCLSDGQHIWTALGCLPIDLSLLIKDYIFVTGVGIAGSIAFLYFLYGAFMILTSSGDAERIEEAKQVITSSLTGLLLIVFSIFLLKVIGVDILALPGFG